MFFGEHAPGQEHGVVPGVNGDFRSAQDVAGIHFGGNQVDGAAAHRIPGFDNGAVDVFAVHARAAVPGQEGGVDVKDAPGPAPGEGGVQDAQPAGEGGEVDAEVAELIFDSGT